MTRIDEVELPARVERMSNEELDSLPFGVIRVDAAGRVVYMSRTEATQSGFGDRIALGRTFFTDLAPCLGTPQLLRRIENAQAEGLLDISFDQVGDFGDPQRELHVRLKSAAAGGLWVFIERSS